MRRKRIGVHPALGQQPSGTLADVTPIVAGGSAWVRLAAR